MGGTGEYDVVVVGSGAGGGTAASALAEAGLRVCMLEKGPHLTEADFIHDELAMCRRWYLSPNPFDEPNLVAANGGAAMPTSNGWIASCVGGGTVQMSGFFYRLHADDFRLRTKFGAPAGTTLVDWPITLAELSPYYDEIDTLIGVAGDAAQVPWMQPAFPLGPIAQHPIAPVIDAAVKQAGRRAYQTPRAILSGAYAGRAACHYCGFCASYGCEVGAKSSTHASLIPLGVKTGKLEVVANAMALRIETNAKGHASAVVWTDGKQQHRASGRTIVVTAGAVQTARLLLASALANQSGQLGKHLMFSAQSRSSGVFALPHASFAKGRDFPFLDRTSSDFYLTKDKRFAHAKAGVMVFLMPHVNPIFQAELAADRGEGKPPLWGAALTRKLRETFVRTRRVELETFAEFFSHPGSHVALDDKVKDKFGQPVARITTALHPASKLASELLTSEGEKVLAAAGATIERAPRDPDVYWFLQAGTARMVKKASDGVIGADGQAFDVPNLYVADGAALPTAGGAPFTLTIMANALRIARGIAARASRGEL